MLIIWTLPLDIDWGRSSDLVTQLTITEKLWIIKSWHILRVSDLQSDSDLDSIRNSCDVWYRKSTEREEIKRKWGNLESEFLSTSSFSLHFLFIFSFSLHFLEGRRATQVRDNHNKFRSILNNRKDKHQRYRWEMHITQWRQSTCLRNPWVISVTAHKSCVCVFVTDY